MRILQKLLGFLQFIYMIRFPLIAFLFLLFFRIIVFNMGIGRSLLGGFFDLQHLQNTLWFAYFSYILSWTATTLMKITIVLGPERFFRGNRINKRFANNRRLHQFLFVLSCLCPLVIFSGIYFTREHWLRQLFGLFLGTILALATLLAVDALQLLFRPPQEGMGLAAGRNLLIPFNNRISDYFAKRPTPRWAKLTQKQISQYLQRIPHDISKGYLYRTNNVRRIYPGHVLALLMLFVFIVIYLTGFVSWYVASNYDWGHNVSFGITAISYVLILVTLLCLIFSGAAFFLDKWRLPTLLLALILLSFSNVRHIYEAPNPDRKVPRLSPLTPSQIIEQRKSPYIIVVAANGGGIQASAWTAKVLSELVRVCQGIDKNAPGRCEKSIALISGVSGGSAGTMFFANAFSKDGKLDDDRMDQAVNLAKDSSLDPIAGGLIYADLLKNLPGVDYLLPNDRGIALEKSWLDNALVRKSIENLQIYKDANGNEIESLEIREVSEVQKKEIQERLKNATLLSWREDARKGFRPAVILNSTEVETGERVIFSTTDITEYSINSKFCEITCPLPAKCMDHRCSKLFRGWKSFHTLFPEKDLRIRTAARLSASFPFVSPAANMEGYNESLEGRHFVDGGFNDNYGVSSMLDWLDEALSAPTPKKPRILIVQIIADEVFKENKVNNLGGGWLNQLKAPATTILGIRNTVQLSHNESELEMFIRYWQSQKIDIKKAVFEYVPSRAEEAAPLSWHLTPVEKKNIDIIWSEAGKEGQKNSDALGVFFTFIKKSEDEPDFEPQASDIAP